MLPVKCEQQEEKHELCKYAGRRPEESAVTPVVLRDHYMSETQIFTDLTINMIQ